MAQSKGPSIPLGGGAVGARVAREFGNLGVFTGTVDRVKHGTSKRVRITLREQGVGVIRTARARRGWPPKELKAHSSELFNDCAYTVDEYGTRVSRWVDNNIVTFVSTIHDTRKSVEADRKRPRKTKTNANNVQDVWGDEYVKKKINIPQFINDYNY